MKFLNIVRLWRRRDDDMKLRSFAIGVNSSVDITQDFHCVFLDFDVTDQAKVVLSVEECQRFWDLSDFHVWKTKNGFHAIGWYDHLPYERVKMIIDYARFVDPMFKMISKYHMHKTLRVAGKHVDRDIRFVGIVSGVRTPSSVEWELGELKRKEHLALVSA
jgi:hypothetical protein